MSISELIAAVGDANVEMQNLDQCAISMDYGIKKGTKITFGTEQPIGFDGTYKLGLVLWLPRDAVKAAIAKERAEKASP